MNKVYFTIDSASDLPEGFSEEYSDTEIIPLYINLGNQSFADGKDIKADDIISFVSKEKILPKTSAVTVGDYEEVFKRLTEKGYSVVHISLSSEISSSYQNAVIAASGFDNIYVVDSLLLSSSIALLLMKGCELRKSGVDASAIANELQKQRGKVVTSFIVDKLDYLHKGGRCSALSAFGANALGLKLCIEMNDGKLSVKKKYRGKLLACQQSYIDETLSEHSGKLDSSAIILTHTIGLSSEGLEVLKNQIRKNHNFSKIYIGHAGCTITSHCGPNTMGILFMTE